MGNSIGKTGNTIKLIYCHKLLWATTQLLQTIADIYKVNLHGDQLMEEIHRQGFLKILHIILTAYVCKFTCVNGIFPIPAM